MIKNLTMKECSELNGGYGAGMVLFGPIAGILIDTPASKSI